MAGGAHDQATMNRYAEAQARLEHAGGYGWRDHATSVLRGLGFAEAHLDRPLRTFSGGELTRASLARALGGDPDLLLLDEPTNHLDVASLEWLERELQSLDAAVILVAHDRWFLEAVTTATLEVVAGRGDVLPRAVARVAAREGGADAARAEGSRRACRRTSCGSSASSSASAPRRTKAKQAQAKLTQIGRLEKERQNASAEVALLSRRQRSLGFEFLKPPRSGRTVVEADGLAAAHRRARAAARRSRSRSSAASTSRSSARTAPARRRCSRRCSDAARRRPGACTSVTASRRRTSRSRSSSSTRAARCCSACRR